MQDVGKKVQRRWEYWAYLRSQAWSERRAACLKRANYQCELCGWRKARQAHHKTYVRFKNERPEDLIAICRICHGELHRARSK